MLRVTSYCMQNVKNITKGIPKNQRTSAAEKDYDLDRRRDSDALVDLGSLTSDDKVISYFDTEELDLLFDINVDKATSEWISDGEV